MLIAVPRFRILKFAVLAFLGIQATVFIVISILRHDTSILTHIRETVTGSYAAVNNDSIEAFLAMYQDYCTRFLTPRSKNVAEIGELVTGNGSAGLCPCIPDTLGKMFAKHVAFLLLLCCAPIVPVMAT
jgi:hypothetical protein